MINKIKQNPVKGLSILAGIFFLIAILCMLLPGIAYDGKCPPKAIYELTITASLFAFIFGGKAHYNTIDDAITSKTINMRVNGMTVFATLLLLVAIVLTVIVICGLFKGKFSNKKKITLAIIIGVLVVASSLIIFLSKDSMIRYALIDKKLAPSEATIIERIKELEATGKFMLGLGAVLTPIMMILGAGSIVGATIISVKKAK